MRLPVQIQALVFRIRNNRPEFLLLKRVPEKGGFWMSVSGGFDEGDISLLETCYRELKEELDINKSQIQKIFERTYIYQFVTDPIKNKETTNYKNLREDTLTMTTFVFGFQVDSEFDPDFMKFSDFSVEHTEFKWLTLDEARNLLNHENSIRAIESINAAIS